MEEGNRMGKQNFQIIFQIECSWLIEKLDNARTAQHFSACGIFFHKSLEFLKLGSDDLCIICTCK